jgi:pimeloyl-ACP methyl ester carboxylesterase
MELTMNVRKTISSAVAVSLSFATGCMSAAEQGRDLHPPAGVTNIVLVHGAWADGSSWAKVIPTLQAHGYHVVAVQNPLTSLADDVAATRRVIALQSGPVLLVGHSYAGAVITEAGNDPKVAGLVYLSAFAPDEGQSTLEQGKPYPTPGGGEIRPDASGFLWLTDKGVSDDFVPDLPPEERGVRAATQVPWSVNAAGARITVAAWRTKPCWYVVAADDRMVSPDLERSTATKLKATTIELKSGHVSMLSHPAEVEAFIEKAAVAAGTSPASD